MYSLLGNLKNVKAMPDNRASQKTLGVSGCNLVGSNLNNELGPFCVLSIQFDEPVRITTDLIGVVRP